MNLRRLLCDHRNLDNFERGPSGDLPFHILLATCRDCGETVARRLPLSWTGEVVIHVGDSATVSVRL